MAEAFEDAYHRWFPSVTRSAWTVVRDRAVAEELAQDAFVKAYARWGRLSTGGYAQPWIHRTVLNLALSWVRRHRRGEQLEQWVAESSSAAHVTQPRDDEVVALLRRLPKRQREAVFLRVVADLSEEEVAALMGCSVGSVKVHKKRGLDRLRQMLEATEGARDVVRG